MMKTLEMQDKTPVILVTGGAGYIGSHFIESWALHVRDHAFPHRIVVLDDLSNGHFEIIQRLDAVFQSHYIAPVIFEKVDLCNLKEVHAIFEKHQPELVVHFAGKISVAESVEKPDFYHQNNVEGSENLLSAMREFQCKKMVFSSTAAVYGNEGSSSPILESASLAPLNPYGITKLKIEQSIAAASEEWGLQGVIFRYFNAAGASISGQIGEWHEPETHLIPLVIESALSAEAELKLFGKDYPTRDGTCVRDYIHVTDLAMAHILGVGRLLKGEVKDTEVYNLGTEQGTSVQEVIDAVQKIIGKKVKVREYPRRSGDAATLVASSAQAKKVLGWKPVHSEIETILRTAEVWFQSLKELKGQV
jgi:UDP-glucose-4-epimerase GalE